MSPLGLGRVKTLWRGIVMLALRAVVPLAGSQAG
jgi:hypothetical protein